MLVKRGDRNNNVKYIQRALTILCYDVKGIDGNFGTGTEAAVKCFQRKNNLEVDGIVGDITWNQLLECMKPIQRALNQHGYNTDKPDGLAGEKIYSAVLEFQKKNNLMADGMVGTRTWTVLNSVSCKKNNYSINNIKNLVNVALSELGYVEGKNNNTKYGEWYRMNNQPWCAMFVSWCADQAGVLKTPSNVNGLVPLYASVHCGVQWYQNKGRFGRKGSYKPHYGDILFLKSSGASHTGIVVGYDKSSNKVCTVEGNFQNKVAIVCRNGEDRRITGYGINGSESEGFILSNAIWDTGVQSNI